MLRQIIHSIFITYLTMIALRIIASWFPRFAHSKFVRLLAFYTDPYLNLIRRVVPPIGGVFDLSPLLGYFLLYFLESIVLKIV